jgi:hypothetical protein
MLLPTWEAEPLAIATSDFEVVALNDRDEVAPVTLHLVPAAMAWPSGGWALGETIWSETRRGISSGTVSGGKAKRDVGDAQDGAVGRLPSYLVSRLGQPTARASHRGRIR